MVPNGLDGERQLLRTGFRQSTGRHPQERLVSGRLARERQLLHPLKVRELGASWRPHHRYFHDCQAAPTRNDRARAHWAKCLT